jgi:hypothetical protein
MLGSTTLKNCPSALMGTIVEGRRTQRVIRFRIGGVRFCEELPLFSSLPIDDVTRSFCIFGIFVYNFP